MTILIKRLSKFVQEAGGSKGTALTGVIQEYKGSVYDRYSHPPRSKKLTSLLFLAHRSVIQLRYRRALVRVCARFLFHNTAG